MNDNVLAILRAEAKKLEQKYGSGILARYTEEEIAERKEACPAISTGSLSLDEAIGVGGLPLGRITEIFGLESSGKTSLSLRIIAETQARGEIAAIIDSENALDLEWAKKMGVRLEDLLVSQPDFGEAAIDVAKALIKTGHVRTIVFDSVAAMQPKEVIEADTNKRDVAQLARMMSQELAKLSPAVKEHDICCIFTNQVRDSMNMGGWGYVDPYTTPGGHALKFWSSLRIECKAGAKDETGRWIRAKCVKNKVAPPFREGKFFINFTQGIYPEREIFELAKDRKVLKAAGSSFRLADPIYAERLGVGGWQAVVNKIQTDPEYKQILLDGIRKASGITSSGEEDFEE